MKLIVKSSRDDGSFYAARGSDGALHWTSEAFATKFESVNEIIGLFYNTGARRGEATWPDGREGRRNNSSTIEIIQLTEEVKCETVQGKRVLV